MTYYVVRHGKKFDPEAQEPWLSLNDAMCFADTRRKDTGFHYYVMKTESVFTTKTLADLTKEDEQ